MTDTTPGGVSDAPRPLAIVTGGNTGIGFETSRLLMERGYDVVIGCRNPGLGATAAARLASTVPYATATFYPLNLADMASVRSFAASVVQADCASGLPRLVCIVCNAGMNISADMHATPASRTTVDGWELCMQTNYLGHAHLVLLLLDHIIAVSRRRHGLRHSRRHHHLAARTRAHHHHAHARAVEGGDGFHVPSRIVMLGSVAHRLILSRSSSQLRWGAMFTAFSDYTYNASKMACTMFAYHLQRALDDGGVDTVQCVAANPGAVASDIWRHLTPWALAIVRPVMSACFLTPEQGAAPSVAAATATVVDGHTMAGGEYIIPYHVAPCPCEPLSTALEAIGPFAGARLGASTRISHDRALAAALLADTVEALRTTYRARPMVPAGGDGLGGTDGSSDPCAAIDSVVMRYKLVAT